MVLMMSLYCGETPSTDSTERSLAERKPLALNFVAFVSQKGGKRSHSSNGKHTAVCAPHSPVGASRAPALAPSSSATLRRPLLSTLSSSTAKFFLIPDCTHCRDRFDIDFGVW